MKSTSKVKPKGRPSGAKNKKRSRGQAGLDESTRREPSRFEHDEAPKSHCTRVIDENSGAVEIPQREKTKQIKTREAKKRLESRGRGGNCNHGERNKKAVKDASGREDYRNEHTKYTKRMRMSE